MEKIVLDTNFIMIPGQIGLDIFDEIKKSVDFLYELYIVDLSLKELEKIQETGSMADKRAAKIALELVKTKNINIIPSNSKEFEGLYCDDVLIKLSNDHIIATSDKELASKLKGKKLVLRQKKYIELR